MAERVTTLTTPNKLLSYNTRGVKKIRVELIGGGGGSAGNSGGRGGKVTWEMEVNHLGESLYFYVGYRGDSSQDYEQYGLYGRTGVSTNPWYGGQGGTSPDAPRGGGGGWATACYRGGTDIITNLLAVAGGGGGGGDGQGGHAEQDGIGAGPGKAGTAGVNGAPGAGGASVGDGSGAGGAGSSSTEYPRGGLGGDRTAAQPDHQFSLGYGSGGGGGGGWRPGGGGSAAGTYVYMGTSQPGASGGGGGSNFGPVGNTGISNIVTGLASSVSEGKVTVTVLEYAPDPASIVYPAPGEVIDRRIVQRFKWKFNDQDNGVDGQTDFQTRYDLRYRPQGQTAWTATISESTGNEYVDFAANHFALGVWEWEVLTYDKNGTSGAYWSQRGTFEAALPPDAPTYTAPTADQEILTDSLVVNWTTSVQEAFQLQLVDAESEPEIEMATIYYDTGTVVDAGIRSQTVMPENSGRLQYIRLRVRDAGGLWSAWALRRFFFNAARPPKPTLVVSGDDVNYRIRIDAQNPVPDADQVEASTNSYYRREFDSGDEFERIAIGIPVGTPYYDYGVSAGIEYEYMVEAVSYTGGRAKGEPSGYGQSITFKGTLLHSTVDPMGTMLILPYNQSGGSETWSNDAEFTQFAGRRLPVVEFGDAEAESVEMTFQLDGRPAVDALRNLARSKEILCYRDSNGRRLFGVFVEVPMASIFYGGTTTLTLTGVDYSEDI